MTDTVIQSFCERCGTRYASTEQEAPRERGRPTLRSFGKRGAPRGQEEAAVATALPTSEAFRETFHFCFECRQYICPKCWDDDAAHCLSCGPASEAGQRIATELPFTPRLPGSQVDGDAAPGASDDGPHAWPTTDLARQDPPVPPTALTGSPPDAPSADPWTGRPATSSPSVPTDAAEGRAVATAAGATVDPWRDVRYSAAERIDRPGTAEPAGPATGAERVAAPRIAPGDTLASEERSGDGPAQERGDGPVMDAHAWVRASPTAIGSAWRARMALPSEGDLELEVGAAHPLDRIAWDRDAPSRPTRRRTPPSPREPASDGRGTDLSPSHSAAPSRQEPVPTPAPVAPHGRPSLPPGPLEPPSAPAAVPSLAARATAQPAAVTAVTAAAPAPRHEAVMAAPPAIGRPPVIGAAPGPAMVAPLPMPALPATAIASAPPAAMPRQAAAAGPSASKARPCKSCALPLSAQARFCRRCGVSQG